MDIKQVPHIKKVLKSIEKMNQITFPKFEDGQDIDTFINTTTNILLEEFGFIFNPKKPLTTDKFLSRVFRVRELDSFTNINLIREHSYPPIHCTKMGRCNFPNYPVFYCSDDPMTALLEVVKNNEHREKKYCISKWEMIPIQNPMIFEDFLQTDLPKENRYTSISEALKKTINSPFEKSFNQKLEKEQEEGLLEYLKYLHDSFLRDNDYSLSATLAHRTLYAKHNYNTDVLMYPSIQTSSKGVNFAIHPNFVENNMRLSRLYILRLDNYNAVKNTVALTFSDYAIIENNVVMWKEIKPNDDFYDTIIREDFGERVHGKFEEIRDNLSTN